MTQGDRGRLLALKHLCCIDKLEPETGTGFVAGELNAMKNTNRDDACESGSVEVVEHADGRLAVRLRAQLLHPDVAHCVELVHHLTQSPAKQGKLYVACFFLNEIDDTELRVAFDEFLDSLFVESGLQHASAFVPLRMVEVRHCASTDKPLTEHRRQVVVGPLTLRVLPFCHDFLQVHGKTGSRELTQCTHISMSNFTDSKNTSIQRYERNSSRLFEKTGSCGALGTFINVGEVGTNMAMWSVNTLKTGPYSSALKTTVK